MAWHLKHYTNILIWCIVPTIISCSLGKAHAASAALKLAFHDPALVLQDNRIPCFFVISVTKWWPERKWGRSSLQHHLPPSASLLKWASQILPLQTKQTHPSFTQSPLVTGTAAKSSLPDCKSTISRRQFAWLETYKHTFLVNSLSKEPCLPAPSPDNPCTYFSCWVFLPVFPPHAQIIAVKKNGFTSLLISLSEFFSGD